MPDNQNIIGLPDFELVKIHNIHPQKLEVRYVGKIECPHCLSLRLRIKDSFLRNLRHESWGTYATRLLVWAHKYHCQDCGRYFNSRFPGILPYQRATESFKKEIVEKHHFGISQQALSKREGLGNATIERWYHQSLELKRREFSDRQCPRVLGIDEHFFTRKKGFVTTFVDLAKHRVFELALGRSENALESFLKRLKGRERVLVVVIDLSATYRAIVKKYFPNAKIVSDRFHVIRMINHAFLKTWHQLDENSRWNRGLSSLMRRHQQHLSDEQKINLRRYLESIPGLDILYDFKQDLCKVMLTKSINHYQAKLLIPQFLEKIRLLKESGFEIMRSLGKTLDSWKEEIARMWRFTKTNSITEGLYTKMEMINRRAYGFRNFENYKLRVIVLCG